MSASALYRVAPCNWRQIFSYLSIADLRNVRLTNRWQEDQALRPYLERACESIKYDVEQPDLSFSAAVAVCEGVHEMVHSITIVGHRGRRVLNPRSNNDQGVDRTEGTG